MEIVLKRIAKKNDYTIGRLYLLADGDVKHKVHSGKNAGNKAEDTQGCILVGENRVKGMVVNSRIWLHRLMKKMNEAQLKEESIWITII